MNKEAIPTTIKFSPDLQEKIAKAAAKTTLSKQEIIRLCLAIGLEDLARCDHNLAAAVRPATVPISSDGIEVDLAEVQNSITGKARKIKESA